MTNDTKHSPEPWGYSYREKEDRYVLGGKSGDFGHFVGWSFDGVTTKEEDEANARRMVACVTACEGLNPEAVPKLLAACKTLRKALWTRRYTFTFMARDRQAMSDGTDAINHAEGDKKA